MKRPTLRLIAFVSALYLGLVFAGESLFSAEVNAPLYFLLAPMLLVIIMFVRDLASRATVPTKTVNKGGGRSLRWKVQQLTRQIQVGSSASSDYFDAVLLARIREVLVEKVSLETGLEKEHVRKTLKNKALGLELLGDQELYALLYSGVAMRGPERMGALQNAIRHVETWKA